MEKEQKKKLMDNLPLLVFIIIYFLLHLLTDWMEVTQFIIATFLSVLTFGLMVHDYKDEHKDKKHTHNKLNFFVGLLSIIFVIIFLSGFLHWNRMVSLSYRMGSLFFLLLLYFVLLFRAMRTLSSIRMMVEGE